MPSLRKQVSALMRSIKGLVNALVFLLAIFTLFGIVGLLAGMFLTKAVLI